jgi:tetratricopeptide (TPR) repeat protein
LFLAGYASAVGGSFLQPDKGLEYLANSLNIWRELGQDYYLEATKCLLIQGFILNFHFSDIPENEELGYKLMSDCIKTFQEAGNLWWHAWAVNLTANYEEKRNDPLAYREFLRKESLLWKKAGDHWGEAMPVMDWGHYALNHGLFMEAQEYLLKSLAIYQEFSSIGMIFQILRDLSHITRALHEYDLAEAYLDQCLALCCQLGWDDPVNRTR